MLLAERLRRADEKEEVGGLCLCLCFAHVSLIKVFLLAPTPPTPHKPNYPLTHHHQLPSQSPR